MAIRASRGSGDLPDPDRIPQHDLGILGEGMMASIRLGMEGVANVPDSVQAAIDAFDPERTAWVVTEQFSDDQPVGGRPVYAARPPQWQALEGDHDEELASRLV